MRVLLDSGIIPYLFVKDSINFFAERNEIFVINERKNIGWDEAESITGFFNYSELLTRVTRLEFYPEFDEILKKILDDSRTFFLLERVTRSRSHITDESLFNNSIFLHRYVYNSLALLKEIQPDILIFQATPHHINSWILSKVAEELGVGIFMFQNAPLPGRFWLVEGLDILRPVTNVTFPVNKEDNEDLNLYKKKVLGSYQQAIPSYEKKRLEARRGKFWSWRKEFKDGFKDPRIFISLHKKRRLYNLYNRLAQKELSNKSPFLVFFLHYQPERTSLPEAFHYFQQVFIIKQLSSCLPVGWKLKVKEHPSTFTGFFDSRYRSDEFYREVADLDNVEWVSLEVNSFDLMENSSGIITLTGTVGIEALLRGIPTITYGVASYRMFKFCTHIDSAKDLFKFFRQSQTIVKKDIQENTLKEMEESLKYSVSGVDDKHTDIHSPETRLKGHGKLLSSVLQYFDSL